MPRVSIIIPCFNHGPYVAEAVESALAQTHRDVEVIESSSGVRSRDSRSFAAGELGPDSAAVTWKGQGIGWMRIYVDEADNYLGYTWSMTGNRTQPPGTPASWTYYSANFIPESVRHFVVGRVVPP